jgi:hypothetical protein
MADRPDVTTTIRRDRPTRSVAARRMEIFATADPADVPDRS